MNFNEKLQKAVTKNQSLVCVGLDPDLRRMPDHLSVADFNKEIVAATADLVCAYKPNIAFYEAMGAEGMKALTEIMKAIPKDIPVIIDAKRGDIGNTSIAYARALFDLFGCDAATVNPYLGFDAIEPFIQYTDKGIFILCRTSNPGAEDFQSLICVFQHKTRPLFEVVADRANEWNTNGNVGLVVGATYPEELKLLRQQHPHMPFLIPGVGAQGGDVELTVRYGVGHDGGQAIVSSTRQIIYASKGKDFAEAARKAAIALRDEINKHKASATMGK